MKCYWSRVLLRCAVGALAWGSSFPAHAWLAHHSLYCDFGEPDTSRPANRMFLWIDEGAHTITVQYSEQAPFWVRSYPARIDGSWLLWTDSDYFGVPITRNTLHLTTGVLWFSCVRKRNCPDAPTMVCTGDDRPVPKVK